MTGDEVRTWLHVTAEAIGGPPDALRDRVLDAIVVTGMLASIEQLSPPAEMRTQVEDALPVAPERPALVVARSPAVGRVAALAPRRGPSRWRWYPWGAATATTIAVTVGLVVFAVAQDDGRRPVVTTTPATTPATTTPSLVPATTPSSLPPVSVGDDGTTSQPGPSVTVSGSSTPPSSTDLAPLPLAPLPSSSPLPPSTVTTSTQQSSTGPTTATSAPAPSIVPSPPTVSSPAGPTPSISVTVPSASTVTTTPSTVPQTTPPPTTPSGTTNPLPTTTNPLPTTTNPVPTTTNPVPTTTSPPAAAPTYTCSLAVSVGIASATLRGLTTDPAVVDARFDLTPPDGTIAVGTSLAVQNGVRIVSATVIGLRPGTSYTFRVEFLDQDGRVLGVSAAGGCEFTTALF